MAHKTTYVYKIIMSRGNSKPITDYCYARNKSAAIDGMKEIYKEKKFDHFNVVCFAEAEFSQHPNLFEKLSERDVAIVKNRHLADAEKYSRRKDVEISNEGMPVPQGAQFVTPEELDGVLS